ncbi:MAG: hypothetical protein GX929_09250 [Clostridiales bacterium]|jgi:hypothetical protein|nr:hypothetical protein [Clostridiales bacterium]
MDNLENAHPVPEPSVVSPDPAASAVCPFGNAPWLGIALTALLWLKAVWSVGDRFLTRLLDSADSVALSGYINVGAIAKLVIFSCGFLVLYLIAARRTESIPNRAAFLLCALSEGCMAVPVVLSLLLPTAADPYTSLYLGAALGCASSLALTVGFFIFAVNRENSRDTRLCAGFVVPAHAVRTFAVASTYFATWMIYQGGAAVWMSVLAVSGFITLFTGIIADILSGAAFLFMRTPVRTPQYPEKNPGSDGKRQENG